MFRSKEKYFKLKNVINKFLRFIKCNTSNIVNHGLFDHESKNIIKSNTFLE